MYLKASLTFAQRYSRPSCTGKAMVGSSLSGSKWNNYFQNLTISNFSVEKCDSKNEKRISTEKEMSSPPLSPSSKAKTLRRLWIFSKLLWKLYRSSHFSCLLQISLPLNTEWYECFVRPPFSPIFYFLRARLMTSPLRHVIWPWKRQENSSCICINEHHSKTFLNS